MHQSSQILDRLDVVFDDKNAVAGGGLVLPMTLAGRLGLRELFDDRVDLGGDGSHHSTLRLSALDTSDRTGARRGP